VLLRCTNKVLTLLGKRLALIDAPPADDDWYANLLWLDRRKCLLLTHAGTLFSVFIADVRKRDLQPPGLAVARAITNALRYEELPLTVLGPIDPDSIQLAKTASRQVLGHMNEIAFYCSIVIDDADGLAATDIDQLNHDLRRRVHNIDGVYSEPLDLIAQRLNRR
jgi:hypothetical protein